MKAIFKLLLLLGVTTYMGYRYNEVRQYMVAPIHLTQGIATNVELRQIRHSLVAHEKIAESYLKEQDFESWVKQEFSSKVKEPIKDPWKKDYKYERSRTGFEVSSAGPDGRHGTEDDIALTWDPGNASGK